MITKTYDIVLQLTEQDYIKTGIKLVENDNLTYIFNIKILDGINEIDYDQVASATITFVKNDSNVVQGNLTKTATGYTYTVGTNEIAIEGKLVASVQLVGAGNERITTSRFEVTVIKDLITANAVQSTTEFAILQQLKTELEAVDVVALEQEVDTHVANTSTAHGINNKLDTSTFNTHNTDLTKHIPYTTLTNSGNAYSGTFGLTSLTDGQTIKFKCNEDSTGNTTVNCDSLGAKNLVRATGTAVTNLKANGIYTAVYNSSNSNFILQGEGGEYGTATAGKVIAGYTIVTENGLVEGTIIDRTFAAGNTYTEAVSAMTDGLGNLCFAPQKGFYNEVTNEYGFGLVLKKDNNFVAKYIENGISIFGLVGTNTNRKWASGTTIANSNVLTISSLTFQPTVIILKWGSYGSAAYKVNANNGACCDNATVYTIAWTTTNTGFTATCTALGNLNVYWEAFI